MRKESKRAAVLTLVQRKAKTPTYRRLSRQTSRINDVLAVLVFGLQSPCCDTTDRATILNVINGLIRLKIDTGLLGGGRL